MAIRPVDLPKLRADLIALNRQPDVQAYWERHAQQSYYRRIGVSGARLASYNDLSLRSADLYFVNPEMTQLAVAAGETLPAYTLEEEDVPSRYGVLYFSETDGAFVAEHDTHLVGMIWGMAEIAGGAPAIYLVALIDMRRTAEGRGVALPPGAPPVALGSPRLFPLGMFAVEVVPEEGDSAHAGFVAAGRLVAAVRASWLLMQQPITALADAEYRRHDRRRLEQQGLKADPVRVITLRRAKSNGEYGPSDREYHHQWIVRGHWRQQYYPSREVHRPVWIAPHIKGPEGAPMLGGEKVYAWTR